MTKPISFGLDAELALELADKFARCLREGADYHNARTDLLHSLPIGTTYEQVQGYKRFLDREMQRRSKMKRQRTEGFKNLPFAPVAVHEDDIR